MEHKTLRCVRGPAEEPRVGRRNSAGLAKTLREPRQQRQFYSDPPPPHLHAQKKNQCNETARPVREFLALQYRVWRLTMVSRVHTCASCRLLAPWVWCAWRRWCFAPMRDGPSARESANRDRVFRSKMSCMSCHVMFVSNGVCGRAHKQRTSARLNSENEARTSGSRGSRRI